MMKKSIEQGIIVSIGNQKGGVGKSVITSLVANYIHKQWGHKFKIIVVDCDDLQGSLYNLRIRELKEKNETESNHYRLLQIDSHDLPSNLDFLSDEYDIIFLDLPGNLKQPGVIKCYYGVDVLITPTQTNSIDLQSTFDFVKIYGDIIIPQREKHNLKTSIYGLFSRVDSQNKDYKYINSKEGREQLPIEFLQNFVADSKVVFQRNVSTLEVYENNKYANYQDLCEEILSIILSTRDKYGK